MRWQVLMAVVSVSLSVVAPVSATVIDFSTDPQLATDWTKYGFYSSPGAESTATWNSVDECLSLQNSGVGADVALYKNGDTRLDSDPVTLTLSDISFVANEWISTGLVVSNLRNPTVFDHSVWYSVAFNADANGMTVGVTRSGYLGGGPESIGSVTLTEIPTSGKFDITRDGSAYVFLVNGYEIGRDSSMSSTSLPYYMMYWGSSAPDTLSVSADNYGVVPEPGTIVLSVTGLIGLLAYAWRKRR